jgi:hypothetical protein
MKAVQMAVMKAVKMAERKEDYWVGRWAVSLVA